MNGPSVVPENFNARYDRGAQGARGIGPPPARRGADSALRRMENEVPGLQVEFDETTGLPSRIATTEPAAELAPPEPTPRTLSASSSTPAVTSGRWTAGTSARSKSCR